MADDLSSSLGIRVGPFVDQTLRVGCARSMRDLLRCVATLSVATPPNGSRPLLVASEG